MSAAIYPTLMILPVDLIGAPEQVITTLESSGRKMTRPFFLPTRRVGILPAYGYTSTR
ncbi:MAG: hypothetical protein CM15mP103_04740 [Gammaproteobacteria bacterium]|nr:MAG: hypothetical protein CM15mP103_04740 [Gammaproteobacteria bacterium]